MGGLKKYLENGKSWGVERFPPWWGYGYFLELHNNIILLFATLYLKLNVWDDLNLVTG